MVRFKEIKVEDVKKFFNKVGVEDVELPDVEKVKFAVVGGKKDDDTVKAIIKTGEKKIEIPIPMENYVAYLKYGKYDANVKRGSVRKSGSGKRGPRGEKTMIILNEVKKFIQENGQIKMSELWKALASQGIVKYRPQLFQIVKKYCEVEYIESGKRKEMVIKGVKI